VLRGSRDGWSHGECRSFVGLVGRPGCRRHLRVSCSENAVDAAWPRFYFAHGGRRWAFRPFIVNEHEGVAPPRGRLTGGGVGLAEMPEVVRPPFRQSRQKKVFYLNWLILATRQGSRRKKSGKKDKGDHCVFCIFVFVTGTSRRLMGKEKGKGGSRATWIGRKSAGRQDERTKKIREGAFGRRGGRAKVL